VKAEMGTGPLTVEDVRKMNAYWRAANYLSVGQIYLLANPLLRESLKVEHIKPRLLGHWGTTPGLNFIYVHLNRLIKMHDLNVIYVIGPGHGGPGIVANTYLEGTYSEFYPNILAGRGSKIRETRPNMRITMGETWLWKHGAEEPKETYKEAYFRDNFSFWSPLDKQFLNLVMGIAQKENISVVVPYFSQYFFYLLYFRRCGVQQTASMAC
jgi:hypothetical protein